MESFEIMRNKMTNIYAELTKQKEKRKQHEKKIQEIKEKAPKEKKIKSYSFRSVVSRPPFIPLVHKPYIQYFLPFTCSGFYSMRIQLCFSTTEKASMKGKAKR